MKDKMEKKYNKIFTIIIVFCLLLLSLIIFLFEMRNENSISELDKKVSEINKKIEEKNLNNNNKQDNEKIVIDNYEREYSNAIKIPIITYHRMVDNDTKKKYYPNDEWVNNIDEIEKQLDYLYINGWKTIDLNEFYCWYNKECEFSEKTFIITIDDGDSEVYYYLLPLLEKYNFKATAFLIGKYIPEITERLDEPTRKKLGLDIINMLRSQNSLLSFESHSYNLHYAQNKKEILLLKSKKELEDDFKNNEKFNFKYLAYPYGVYNKNMLEVISNSYIKMAFKFKNSTYATRLDSKYEISRLKINSFMNMEKFIEIFDYAN